MDEVEFRRTYNQANDAAQKITAPETQRAVMFILQLLNGLQEQISEMQVQEEDE
jgi:hypothetical protein